MRTYVLATVAATPWPSCLLLESFNVPSRLQWWWLASCLAYVSRRLMTHCCKGVRRILSIQNNGSRSRLTLLFTKISTTAFSPRPSRTHCTVRPTSFGEADLNLARLGQGKCDCSGVRVIADADDVQAMRARSDGDRESTVLVGCRRPSRVSNYPNSRVLYRQSVGARYNAAHQRVDGRLRH